MLVVLIATLLALPPIALPPIGVARLAADGACVLIDAASLAAGTELTIVIADSPQEVLGATIAGPGESCNPAAGTKPDDRTTSDDRSAEEAGAAGTVYRLRLEHERPETPVLGVAFVGRIPTRRLKNVYELRVSDVYPRVRVRSCTSLEGVYLTVWSGTPRASRQLWRTYWPLGYDVEPTCGEDELRETAPEP